MATIFRPRFNSKDMAPEYYDHYYTPVAGSGSDMANPYWRGDSNAAMRKSWYLWGRWHEASLYASGFQSWTCIDSLGYIKRTRISDGSVTYNYMNYLYWSRPSLLNTSVYTYEQTGGIGSLIGTDIGCLAFYHDPNYSVYTMWEAGVCERVLDANNKEYLLSTWDNSTNTVKTLHVINDVIDGHFEWIGAIPAYVYEWGGGMAPLIPSKQIGWKVPIWMYKKISDRNRGLIE